MTMFHEGLLLVISGPSGTGKGTVLKLLHQTNPNVRFSVSATTRQPRDGEVEGVSYFFKNVEEFERMVKEQELVEWVHYCNNYYGTPIQYIEESKKQGMDVIFEIEVDGALNIKKKYPESILIFILPPSFDELRRRIEKRGTEKPEVIEQRLKKAENEFEYVDKYDYIVINNTVKSAVDDINCIIRAEKLKQSRNKDIIEDLK